MSRTRRSHRHDAEPDVNSSHADILVRQVACFPVTIQQTGSMWKCLLANGVMAAAAFAQNSPQIEIANLREDVRGLTQRVGELTLRLEQLERENAELRQRSSVSDKSYATL